MATPIKKVRGQNGGKRPDAGRKSRAEEMGLMRLLNECWTLAQRERVIRKLAALASKGDIEAIKLLMAYAFGKPTEKHQHSGDVNAPLEIRVVYEGEE